MTTAFSKYQGTGNDFVIFDQMKIVANFTPDQIREICDRRFGVGADGVMFIRPSETSDFKMVYFNADGNESSMCGNGGRCLVHFALSKGYINEKTTFEAIDGIHQAEVLSKKDSIVSLHMNDVSKLEKYEDGLILNTGSPHFVKFANDIEHADIIKEGRAIRYNDDFKSEGINVNLVEMMEHGIYVRTYERGVEEETLSCGTGVTASVIAAASSGRIKGTSSRIKTRGGDLEVKFINNNNVFTNIWLIGPAVCVFKGELII
ncbi:MAG: diaminopimelate epimerase [Bacteroidota bacterium]